MIRVKPGLRSFTVITPDGTRRQFSWLYLLPLFVLPGLLLLVLALQSEIVVRNYVSKARRDPALIGGALETFAHVQRKTIEDAIFALPEPLTSELPTLKLYVATNSLNDMQHALVTGDPKLGHDPGGDQPYFRAYMVDEHGETKKGRVCLRGAGKWHHMPEKPSLRFKIRTADITHGVRYLELSRPEDVLALKNWLPNRLGAGLGLFDDGSRHVRLFINNRYFGVYLQTMRPDEALALANGRMPGTFVKGDFRDDLWDTIDGWRFEGEAAPEDKAAFQRLLDGLRAPPSAATLEALGDLIDFDVYARWSALMIVTGSVHTDLEHNHTYFICSNQGLFEALPWDVNGFGMHVTHTVPVDLILHPVMDRLTRDPRWVLLRNRYLHELLSGPCRPDALQALIDAVLGRMRKDLEADVNLNSIEYMKTGLEVLPWSVLDIDAKRDELLAYIARRTAFLQAYLADARVAVAPDPADPQVSRVTVHGAMALEVRTADGAIPVCDGDPARPGVLYSGLSEDLEEYTEYAYERSFEGRYHGARPAPVVYRVAAPPSALRFRHALTGAAVEPSPAPADAPVARTVHPRGFRALATDDVVLGPGELELTQDLHTHPGQRLIVRAGTTIRLGAGVGIYARGQTLIEGTAEAPVRLVPLETEPWGCLGVAGAATVGTRFEHLEAWGGSYGTNGTVRFKGMVSVYDCPDVTLRGCRFGTNHFSDDTVNLGECDRILVEDCEWRESRSDALDLDMSRGVVRDCRWIDSGNDGLDMMTCQVLAERCTFVGSGDKGISVGEGTRVLVRDCRIERCHIGIEAKDACRAYVRRTAFVGCRVSVNAYQKKWLYPGGGQALLADCTIEGSQVIDLSAKRRSRISLLRTEARSVDRIQGIRVLTQVPEEYAALAVELGGGE